MIIRPEVRGVVRLLDVAQLLACSESLRPAWGVPANKKAEGGFYWYHIPS